MSKKRKRVTNAPLRRLPAQGPQKTEQKETADERRSPLYTMDGFINRLAYLGEASLLNEANDYERHSISRDYELLTVMYRENWIAKRIIDTPCEDMTRSWYSISTALSQEKLEELEKLEARHNVKQEITNGLRWARLYGGAAAVMVIKGQEDMLDQPLEYDDLMPGCFRGLIIVDRTSGLDPSVELEEDMDDPEFGYPKYYIVRLAAQNNQTVRVHHSRMLFFRGRMLPLTEEQTESYWGASELEHVYEELQKRNATSANIAQLVFQANVSALKMADYGEIMGMGTEKQKAQIVEAIEFQNRIRNSFGMMLMGNEDNLESHPYSFSGLSEVYETFMMDMAGAAEIPATKLYGRSPQGMNATGESDMKNYYEMLAQLQERNLRPAIEKLLPVMACSLWGAIPNDMEVVFEPLQTTTPAEKAQIMQQVTGVVVQAFSAGLIAQQTALVEMQKFGKDIGFWDSITDDIIDKAETEVDSGEGDMGGMGGMPGMPGMGGEGSEGPEGGPGGGMPGMMPEGMPEGQPEESEGQPEGQPEEVPQEAPEEPVKEPEKSDEEQLAKILKEAQTGEKEAEDGGPGSGNFGHPGYNRGGGLAPQKASVGEWVRFLQDPTEGKNAPRQNSGPTGSKSHVDKMNREREQWSDLSLHQKVQGNAEQQKHMAKVKSDVVKAAAKGDLDKAREIVRANRQYWSNDPDSAQKVQSETLKRQKAVKPRKSLGSFISGLFNRKKVEDVSTRGKLIKAYAQDHSKDETAEFILRLYGADEDVWRTNEEGNHFKFDNKTGEIKAGFGGRFTGKKIGENWGTGGTKPRKKGSKVEAPKKSAVEKPKGKKVDVSFTESVPDSDYGKFLAKKRREEYDESIQEVKDVFGRSDSTIEEKNDAIAYLSTTAGYTDAYHKSRQGDAPSTSDFGFEKAPKEWVERLSPVEQEVLANFIAEEDEMNNWDLDYWNQNNPELMNAKMLLQAKFLGADVDVDLSPEILEKYGGIEQRVEIPGQQSMFYGENVPMAETPKEPASKTMKEPVDKGYETGYNSSVLGWSRLNAAMEVGGPKAAREYLKSYFRDHPEVEAEIPKYMDVRRKVRDFLKDHPEAENFNTFDAETGKVKEIKNGFCVTFHQNNTASDTLGGYSDEDYAGMCAVAIHELGASGVNIGYYGNPEVSFECSDERKAKEFAVRHNQESVYNASTGRTLHNKKYREDLNPIRL